MAILDLGVAAVVGLQFQGLSVPVGDEAVIAVGGEEGQLGTGRGLHPPDDEPHRCGAGLTTELGALSRRPAPFIVGAVDPEGTGFRSGSENISIRFRHAKPLALWPYGEADIHLTTGCDESVGVEAADGPAP